LVQLFIQALAFTKLWKRSKHNIFKLYQLIKMKIKRLGASKTLLALPSGSEIFYSYETPVAYQTHTGELFKTEEYYSRTTSKHITQYLNGRKAETVSQSFINQLVGV
tara:strand:+ start:1016 stop:1336 length:321 start_codon:yes stop_codon:yes gene_type:complete